MTTDQHTPEQLSARAPAFSPATPPAATNGPEAPASSAFRTLALVGLYAALVYLPFLGGGRTLTAHEGMIAQPARQMLRDGQWIVPHYAGTLWLDKPPLVNWLTAASFAVAGFSEFAARLPAALSAIGLCILVAALTRRFYGDLAGLFAGLVQATSVYMYTQGRLGEIDMPLAFFIAAAHAPLVWRWGAGQTGLPLRPALLFHFAAAAAVLAKGPIALALLAFSSGLFSIFRRKSWPLRCVLFTPALAVFILIAGGWHLAAYFAVRDEAVAQWGYNMVARFLGLHHLGRRPPYYYLLNIPWLVLPWTVVLILGARRLWRDVRHRDAALPQILWAWFLGGLLLLTISAFKEKHYAYPILPPLSVFCGWLMAEHTRRVGRRARRFFTGAFTALLIVFALVSGYVMPQRDHRRPTVEFLRRATALVPPDAPLHVVGLGQSAAYPYIEHRVVYVDDLTEAEAELDELGERPWVLMLHQHLALAAQRGVRVTEIAAEPVREKHPWEETLLLGRAERADNHSPNP